MRVAVCLCVKNEERDLVEWLTYQDAIGFNTVITYDNESTDGTSAILHAVSAVQDVRIVPWERKDGSPQMDAYRDCLAQFGSEFDWIAFIDSDEFIVPGESSGLIDMLTELSHHDAVVMPWAMFGSSGYRTRPNGLTIESFTRRASDDFGPARHVKSIVRPASVKDVINPHVFDGAWSTVTPDGATARWEFPGLLAGRPNYYLTHVNHYFTKSAQQWNEKVRRGYAWCEARPVREFEEYDRNEVEDLSATRYVDAVKERMGKVLQSDIYLNPHP